MQNAEVKSYYDEIATEYDESRFENTYGQFIDKQERKFLSRHINPSGLVLNLGCGTGRFMDFSSHGLDFSEGMLEIAKNNFPDKNYETSSAQNTPYADTSFDTVICFHVIMHLGHQEMDEILKEVHRILKPGGTFIFDIPSQVRRNVTGYKSKGWHGSNGFKPREIKAYIKKSNFKIIRKKGIMFLPVHRFPKKTRSAIFGIDQLLTASFVKNYSSYVIYKIQKT